MSRTARFSVAARQDVDDYAVYLSSESQQAAMGFAPAAVATAKVLGVYPHFGAELTLSSRRTLVVRRWPIKGYSQHLLIYRVRPSSIDVLRVTHAVRDLPRVLQKLLKDLRAGEF